LCGLGLGWAAESDQQFFDKRVAPILIKRCLGCHNNELKNGNISFLEPATLLRGGRRGPAIVPGKPEQSVLISTLRIGGDLQMPPGPPMPSREIAILTEWVKRGGVWGAKLRAPVR
jgi:hypothetical protein